MKMAVRLLGSTSPETGTPWVTRYSTSANFTTAPMAPPLSASGRLDAGRGRDIYVGVGVSRRAAVRKRAERRQVPEMVAEAELHERELRVQPVEGAAEDLLVEPPGARLVTHPQHDVIEPERLELHDLNQYRVTTVSSSPPGAGACLGFGPGTHFLYRKRLRRSSKSQGW